MMELKLVRTEISALETDALILFEAEGNRRADLARPLAALYESGEIAGKFLEFTLLHGVKGFAARRVLVAGSGKPEKLDAAQVLRLAGAAIRFLKGKGVKNAAFAPDPAFVASIAEGVLTGAWEPDRHKTDKEAGKSIDSVTIVVSSDAPELQSALDRGKVIGEALNLARDIAVEPPNKLTPTTMAARARSMAQEAGLSF